MHNLRKSASEHCSFLTADERVTYALAAPAFPFCFRRPIECWEWMGRIGELRRAEDEEGGGRRRLRPIGDRDPKLFDRPVWRGKHVPLQLASSTFIHPPDNMRYGVADTVFGS